MPVTTRGPQPAGQGRRFAAAVIDAMLALGSGLAAGVGSVAAKVSDRVAFLEPQGRSFWLVALAAAVLVSFLNHVLLTVLARASVGKLLVGLRAVRESDGGRPRVGQALKRWLVGYYWAFVIVPIHVAADSSVGQEDLAGLRTVRRKELEPVG